MAYLLVFQLQNKKNVEFASGSTSEAKLPSSLSAFRDGRDVRTSPMEIIYFDFDRYSLRPEARVMLQSNAEWMRENLSKRVEVEGHADERGTNEYNLALKRTESQALYLKTSRPDCCEFR